MTDHDYQQLLKKLLLDAEHLDSAQPSPDAAWLREHAALCRKAAFCIKQLLDSQVSIIAMLLHCLFTGILWCACTIGIFLFGCAICPCQFLHFAN